jgi:protease I
MAHELDGRRVAILATDGVEEVEYTEPRAAVEQAGARAELVSIKPGRIQAMQVMDKSNTYPVDRTVDEANPDDYDALLLPGGVANPDYLRMDPRAVAFVKAFFDAGKPVGAICHGPWMLVEADVVRGRQISSWPSLKTDIRNAGGTWVDEVVHTENGLVTSRKPDDLPQFCAKVVEEFAEGRHRSGLTGGVRR